MLELELGSLRNKLLLGGVAPKFAFRTISELKEHLHALKERAAAEGLSEMEAMARAQQQLGDEASILKEALSKPELKSWSFRYTRSVYLLAPLIIYLVAFLGFLSFVLIGFDSERLMPGWYQIAIRSVLFFSTYLLPLFIVCLFCVMAKRRSVNLLWPALGVLLIGFLGSGWDSHLILPNEEIQGSIRALWGYSFLGDIFHVSWEATFRRLARMAGTLVLALSVLHFYKPYQSSTA